jgi:hypothetical protein
LIRKVMDPGAGYYRSITAERKEGIIKFYEQTALSMYAGFANRMVRFAESGDARQKYMATLFSEALK